MKDVNAQQSILKSRLIALLSHGVFCVLTLCHTAYFWNLMDTASNEALKIRYLGFLSVGITLMNLGYIGYCQSHPSKKPHSPWSALLHTLFYGVVFLLYRPTKKR